MDRIDKRFAFLFTIILFICFSGRKAWAQQGNQISGIVTDAGSQQELPSVNIQVKNTTTGTYTDPHGKYTLTVSSLQDTLVFSFVGYQTKQVPIKGRTTLNVALKNRTLQGQEMVVVGYGTQEEENITGSIDEVSGKELEDRPQANVAELLRGTSPNLNFSMGSQGGEPGASLDFNIRGMVLLMVYPMTLVAATPLIYQPRIL